MDFLDFVRGPLLWLSLAVFVFGTGWRLRRILMLPLKPDLSAPRADAPSAAEAARRSVWRGLWPRWDIAHRQKFAIINAFVFHVGLALVFLGYAPHIAFLRRITWLHWPALPDMVMYLASAVTIVSLLLALWWRITDPVRRLISTTDDWLSWTLIFLPFVTGMAVITEPSGQLLHSEHIVYRGPLAMHLLTLELLLLWFPFGKLMHAILFAFSRAVTGQRFSHRGVQV